MLRRWEAAEVHPLEHRTQLTSATPANDHLPPHATSAAQRWEGVREREDDGQACCRPLEVVKLYQPPLPLTTPQSQLSF